MTLSSSDILFAGSGQSVLSWYRCGAPSLSLGCDWIGTMGAPPEVGIATALKRGSLNEVDWLSYRVIVIQQPLGSKWLAHIRWLQSHGIKVVYEIDDYVHGVRKVRKHAAAWKYTKEHCRQMEICMSACDAMIVSTDFLAQRYRKFNQNIFVCRNGIEGRRYKEFSVPDRGREVIHVGWAGGEGHWDDVLAWMPAIAQIMDEFPHVQFGTIGKRVASMLDQKYQHRIFELPFVAIENYPGALCNFDIAIAPAGRSDFFKGKSDLRWLECGALGIPTVCDPFVYKEVDHEVTGMLATNAEEAHEALRRLITNAYLSRTIAENAKDYIYKYRTIEKTDEQWINVFTKIV